ncbi:MAG: hypothetical protein HYZ37_03320 [Candidatus Solibacter usitatus]|nr:hypothetical protein [Candidatus Solibacter usitatus]
MKPCRTPAVIGLRAHSGWAAAVALTGSAKNPAVVDRRRIELSDSRTPGFPQPYHAAEGLPFPQAKAMIEKCISVARDQACESLRQIVNDLHTKGFGATGCVVLLASGKPLPPLDRVLASHALIHAAEGEMFRQALFDAAKITGLKDCGIRERDVRAETVDELAAMGRAMGPPWREDQKLASMAAWIVLRREETG